MLNSASNIWQIFAPHMQSEGGRKRLQPKVIITTLDAVKYSPLPNALMPLADRLKQAIDKIEEQIKRLENL